LSYQNVQISERALILASAICAIWLAVFYGGYVLGRAIGIEIF
jgi:hypothetical protein